jgi:cysteine synthase
VSCGVAVPNIDTTELPLPPGRTGTSDPTPVLTFVVRIAGAQRRLHLKAEWFSPAGSSKGRTAASLLASVMHRVDPRVGIIESTSGNLGVALATLCAARSIPFTAVVDPRTNQSLVMQMAGLGASIIETTTEDGRGVYLLSRLEAVQEALRRDPRLVWTDQYSNPANPSAHARGTAPELHAQLPTVQQVFVPVSTGGTLAGLRWFADSHPARWRCVGVDMVGSSALGGPSGERVLPGIGASRRSSFLPRTGVDAEHVSPVDAIGACDWVSGALGVDVGGSSGAAVAAALRRMRAVPALTEVACICPDAAAAYRDTLFSPGWRAERGLRPSAVAAEVTGRRAA